MEPGVFEPEETLARGHGSCRDFAWLEVALLRRLGFAARFVSGYSIQLTARRRGDRRPVGRQRGRRRSARLDRGLPARAPAGSASTPPAACWPGRGTSRSPAPRCPSTAAPIIGLVFVWRARRRRRPASARSSRSRCGCAASTRRRGSRKPYREDQWKAIQALGRQVDRDLERLDVRLTMGGEPTFVSIDDRDARRVEHRRARGRASARLADRLLRRLRDALRAGRRAAPRAGEVVPGRAAAALGVLLLLPPRRRADLARARAVRRRTSRRAPPTSAAAAAFIARAGAPAGRRPGRGAARLRGRLLLPVARAPAARRTSTCWTAASTTRSSGRGWRACSRAGLGEVAGYVLPLRARAQPTAATAASRGRAARWSLRGERAVPDARAIRRWASGCRSTACPGRPRRRASWIYERDPLLARPPLTRVVPQTPRGGRSTGPATAPARRRDGARSATDRPTGVVRTALCVEVREGILHVFLPPRRVPRGVPGADRRHRGRGARARPAAAPRGLPAAARSPPGASCR